uniref:GIY-YIG domain-containing protein n=1 Tax=viral metagenome TaxID=1070528 RepID=A0A6C0KG08_9ZZZZ
MEFNIELRNKIIDDETLRWVEIYKITNKINQKVYIGQAISHRRSNNKYYPKGMMGRFKEHMKESNQKQKYHCNALNNAIQSYGSENFNVELLKLCSIEDANKIETYEIQNHNSLVPNGYNINTSCNSLLPSNELREKISIGNINYHYQKHLAKFENILFDVDESEFDKYITPRNKYNTQIGWNLRINKKVIEFKSTIHSLDETKKRAFEFLKLLKEKSNIGNVAKLTGKSLEPSLPLTSGNACEELV